MDTSRLVETEPLPEIRAVGVLRCLGLVALGLLTLGWVARGIGSVLPPTAQTDAERKLAAFFAEDEGYDTLFLGTSLVHRGIDPLVFDAAMTRFGVPTRSFNAALPAMDAFEQEVVLRRILERRPEGLVNVLVAPDMIAANLSAEHLRNRRTALWHETSTTLHVSSALLQRNAPWPDTLTQLYRHWQAWWLRGTNGGEVRERLDAWMRPVDPDEARLALLGPDGRGFAALDQLVSEVSPELVEEQLAFRAQFLGQEEEFTHRVAAFAKRPMPTGPPHAAGSAYLARLTRMAKEAGVRLVVFLLPGGTVEDRDWLLRARALDEDRHWIDLTSPSAFPELYAVHHRFDRFHVNADGAVRMTELLAERFASLLSEGEASRRGPR